MHFTYDQNPDDRSLFQGDVLRRTDGMNEILEKVHPHYSKEDYHYLVVLTQSCDLVRRNSKPCNARYIALAAVRPFPEAIQREVDRRRDQRPDVEREAGIANMKVKFAIRQFVGSLLNNNKAPYFYLHPELEADFNEPHCAFLRLSVAIKASEHYDTCLTAKVLQLQPEFQAKLGWLVTELYGRVGTEDFTTRKDTKPEFEGRIDRILEEEGTLWIREEWYTRLLKKIRQSEGPYSPETALQLYSELTEKATKTGMDRLSEILPPLGLDQDTIDRVLAAVRSDPALRKALGRFV